MHEVIGHASGQVSDRLEGNPQTFLKEQYSALEEARADLVALYFIADPKLVEIGIVGPGDHEDIIRAEYESYTRNRASSTTPHPDRHTNRAGPHAQSTNGCALVNGQYGCDRRATARQ